MPDGEIELQVNADGVEDAAGELDETATETGGGGGGGGGGLGGTGGRMVRLLGAIVGLLALIEPILDVLGVVSNILKAFVAPLAVVLLRVLQPVLRLLLELLPVWLNWVSNNEGLLNQLGAALIPLSIFLPILADLFRKARDLLSGLPSKIGEFFDTLPQDIGDAIAERLPGDASSAASGVRAGLEGDPSGGGDTVSERAGGILGTVVRISGGLTPFVDEIAKNGNVDLG